LKNIIRKIFNVQNIITILTFAISYYWYLEQRKEVDPTFINDQQSKQVLYATDIANSSIRISKQDGKPITSNVYVQTFYFFNQGKLAFRKEDVLAPVGFELGDSTQCQLLDYKILRTSRSIVNARLQRDTINDNRINLSFDILEEDDGFVGQIIYASSEPCILNASGVIAGAPKGFSRQLKPKYGLLGSFINVIILASFVGSIAALIYFNVYFFPENKTTEGESFFGRLRARYILTIATESNPDQRAIVSFTYVKIILFGVTFFVFSLVVTLYLTRTVVKTMERRNNNVEVPETLNATRVGE
jgi:hypothetical protein